MSTLAAKNNTFADSTRVAAGVKTLTAQQQEKIEQNKNCSFLVRISFNQEVQIMSGCMG